MTISQQAGDQVKTETCYLKQDKHKLDTEKKKMKATADVDSTVVQKMVALLLLRNKTNSIKR
jgi:hypothetical protein